MPAELLEIDQRLAEFDQQHNDVGLLCRYARGRVVHFWRRQILTLSGAVALVFLASPVTGLIAVATALLGEAVDCLTLRKLPDWLAAGYTPRRLGRLASVTAGFQAVTISSCVGLAWFSATGGEATFFALAYLTGAAINGGIVFPYHKGAAIARLGIYALALIALFLGDFMRSQTDIQVHLYNLMGAMIMGYMVKIFIEFASNGFIRQTQNSRDLLLQSRAIARANLDLVDQQKEARYLALVAKNANDSVIMSDANGQISWVNAAFTNITGYTADDAIGKYPSDLLNGPETCLETSDAIAKSVRSGQPHRAEILNYTKDRRKIWMETNLVPILAQDGTVEIVVAIERDITAAKENESALAAARIAAETGERSKAEFLANMSHEIRTPMNGISGMADLLAESPLNVEQRLYADTIRSSADALLTIINDILDYSKLDAGMLAICPVPFDLRACVEGVINLLRPQAQAKGLYLDIKLDAGLPDHVLGDDGRLRQILINVIGNAVKFSETGGVNVSLGCTAQGEQHLITVAVRDTGIGVPDDQIHHIFEQFSQADAATTRRFGGTGLGLSISRLLARAMGGNITVKSTQGQGACFTITLLMEPTQETGPVPPASLPKPLLESLDAMVILVAEDNATNRLLIRKYLKDQSVELKFAHDSVEAVQQARVHAPDIILMDMSMPNMDGLEATRVIRAQPHSQPRIIALTANAFASDKAACLAAGMDGFLAKPVRKQQLLETLVSFSPASQGNPAVRA